MLSFAYNYALFSPILSFKGEEVLNTISKAQAFLNIRIHTEL